MCLHTRYQQHVKCPQIVDKKPRAHTYNQPQVVDMKPRAHTYNQSHTLGLVGLCKVAGTHVRHIPPRADTQAHLCVHKDTTIAGHHQSPPRRKSARRVGLAGSLMPPCTQ